MENTTIISISVERVREQILARSAMRHHLGAGRPQMLHGDHSAGVDMLVRSAFGPLCMAMLPCVADCNVGEDTDILTAELRLPEGVPAEGVRRMMEHALMTHVLAEVYAGVDPDAAEVFRAEWRSLTGSLHSAAAGRTEVCEARIRPCWY